MGKDGTDGTDGADGTDGTDRTEGTEGSGRHLNLTSGIPIAGLSSHIIYPGQGLEFKLYVPAGMIIYWIGGRGLWGKEGTGP